MTFHLRDKAPAFMAELWPLLVSAQESKNGVSPQLEEAAEEVSATCKVILCSRFRVLGFSGFSHMPLAWVMGAAGRHRLTNFDSIALIA